MSVDFLTPEQKAQYAQYTGEPDEQQLSRSFYLDQSDLAFITSRRGDHNRLGLALQLTSVRYLGAFLSDLSSVPAGAQLFVGRQLGTTDSTILTRYATRETTKREHTALIKKHYGYRELSDGAWAFRLSRMLYARAWISNERPSVLFDMATVWLIQRKILLPGITTLSRLIASTRERATNRLWQRLSSLPTSEQKEQLETLLQIPDGQRVSRFDDYKRGPTRISAPAFNAAIQRYLGLRALGIHTLDFSRLPPVRLKQVARHAGIISMHKIARMPDHRRTAVLIAFGH